MKTTILLLILTSTSAMASEPSLFERAHDANVRTMSTYLPGPNCWVHTAKCEALWIANGDASGDYGIIDAAD